MSEAGQIGSPPPPELSDEAEEKRREGPWRPVAYLLLLLFASYNIYTFYEARGRRRPELELRAAAPTVALPTLGGGEAVAGPSAGRVVLLDFWATWCPPCVKELPVLHTVAARFKGRPLDVRLVNQDARGPERIGLVKDFAKAHGLRLPVLLDNGSAKAAYRVELLPYLVILDHEGKVAHRSTGLMGAARLEAILEGLVEAARTPNR